jgi:hypothetical protein
MSLKGFITWIRRRTTVQPLTALECVDLSLYDAEIRGRIERGDWPEVLHLKPGFQFQPFREAAGLQQNDGSGI